jgi:aminopeptidase N
MLHTIRSVIDNDATWLQILRGLNKIFWHRTTTTEEIVGYINKTSGKDLTAVFDQYLRYTEIPLLEIERTGKKAFRCRWKTNVANFKMPLKIKTDLKSNKWIVQNFSNEWKTIHGNSIVVDTDNFYVKLNYIKK